MNNKQIAIKRLKQNFNWHCLYVQISEIYDNWVDYDKELEEKLEDLLNFIDSKIALPKNARDIVNTYVVVEYEEINKK